MASLDNHFVHSVYFTLRLHSSSFWGLPYRILHMNPKTELPWSLRASSVCLASFRCELRFLVSAAWSLVEVFLFQAGGAGFNYLRLRGSIIVPFCGWYLGSYKVIPERNDNRAYGWWSGARLLLRIYGLRLRKAAMLWWFAKFFFSDRINLTDASRDP